MTVPPRFASKRIVSAALALAAVSVLTGCHLAVLVGSATGAYVATDIAMDRRTTRVILDDEHIGSIASERIGIRTGDKAHINALSFNYTVLLTGEAPDAGMKAVIEKAVREIPRVKNVVNEIQIAGVSSLASRSNDTYLTGKIKSNFVAAVKFAPSHVKVVTEDGTVYLLGIVTREEANAATEIARSITGVQRVVRVFEYLGPAEQ